MTQFDHMAPHPQLVGPAVLTLLFAAVFFATTGTAFAAAQVEEWGLIDNKPVKLYTLKNANGLILKVTNYGATIVELHTPDRNGKLADISLGYDKLDGYIAASPYFGTIAGRCANRIAKGRFTLDGKTYQLALNNAPNTLHGGTKGFDKQVWDATTMDTPKGPAIKLTYLSVNGEENYPGNLKATVTYTLSNDNELITEITATTDATTLCNLAQHNYWNLGGHDSGTVKEHVLKLYCDRYTPVDDTLIPTGELASVAGTPFDFREPKTIGKDLMAAGGDPIGFDHNFVVNGEPFKMRPVARVHDPKSGRVMELSANQPGVQFYSGNFLDGSNIGKGNVAYQQYNGFCLETQVFPNAIHNPSWPQCVLKPGQTYKHVMVSKFSAE